MGGHNWHIIKKKIIHIGNITVYASLFYLVFQLLQSLFLQTDFSINGLQIFNWIVFNTPIIIAGQYWFLFALLYAYFFYGILEKFELKKFSYVLAAFMFVVYICLAQGAHLYSIKIPNMIYRNWLIEAFPYFMLGHWIHEYQERIKLSNRTLISIIVVATFLCWIERWIMGRDFGVNIVTIPQVFAIFVYGVKNPTKCAGAVQRLGRDCSMMVYILHPVVWHSLESVYWKMGLADKTLVLYLMPLLVLTISILEAFVFNEIVEKYKSLRVAT